MNPADLYLRVREVEGRLLPDDLVRDLPHLPDPHPLAGEWRARAHSLERLKRYLARSSRPLAILDLGCGNGWLSHQLTSLPSSWVCGLDRNPLELAQAARLFKASNLAFLQADIACPPFPQASFHVILMASVIQYFPDLPTLIQGLRPLLKPDGEVHVIDSPLYRPGKIPAARERTKAYYTALGYPEMTAHYFHHSLASLDPFSPRWLYHPESWRSRLARRLGQAVSPFPWICLH